MYLLHLLEFIHSTENSCIYNIIEFIHSTENSGIYVIL